ncbi:MAG: DoxX family membrane protein [Acidimicrobiales bacterium]
MTVRTDLPDPRLMARGLAVLRIFAGVILFANGVAKLFGITTITAGPYAANLINRSATRFILRFEGLQNQANGGPGTEVPGLQPIVRFMLDNFGWVQWLITAAELGIGALLIVGLASRGAAVLGLANHLFLAALYASSNRWLFEQPHEYVPLLILVLVPSGRVWGLDGALPFSRARAGRFPF